MNMTSGRFGHHGSGVARFRNAGATTGAAGAWTALTFDAVNDDVPTVHWTTGLECQSAGEYSVVVRVTFQGALRLPRLGVRRLKNGQVVDTVELPLAVGVGVVAAIGVRSILHLVETDLLSVEIRSVGVGTVAIAAGKDKTKITVVAV